MLVVITLVQIAAQQVVVERALLVVLAAGQ
jgi:hypothetical protein